MSPYASTDDAIAYTPAAEDENATRIQAVLDDAAQLVRKLAPPLPPRQLALTEAMDEASTVIKVGRTRETDPLNLRALTTTMYNFPMDGVLQIDDEKIAYGYMDVERFEFQHLTRQFEDTLIDVHDLNAAVIDRTYESRAKRAELRVFDYLWKTGGTSLSSQSFLGSSATYEGRGFIKGIVNEVMGEYSLGSTPAPIL